MLLLTLHTGKDSPTLFEKIFTKETVIAIGVVPVVAALIITVTLFVIIGVVLCLYYCKKLDNQRDNNNNSNELRHLVVNKTTDVLSELTAYLLTEKNHDVRKEAITTIKEIMLGQLNLCKKQGVTLGTQTSRESARTTSRLSSQQNSTAGGDGSEDVIDGPEVAGDSPPSYESAVAEQELTELLKSCISDIVEAQTTLLQDDGCIVTNHSCTTVTITVSEEQNSTKCDVPQLQCESTV